MYITNDVDDASLAEKSGVDWIFVDLEINGKEDRQGHLDTVISYHSITDVKKIKSVLTTSKLLVRVNPIYCKSQEEINTVIDDGADIVMLPFFKESSEVEKFVEMINGRASVCLLLETKEAVNNLDEILSIKGIDYIHIGLNDLHLSYELNFMFELLSLGIVENIVNKIKAYDIEYGFGGIANLGKGELNSELILNEHLRLGSTMTILSRSFSAVDRCPISKDSIKESKFYEGVKAIRDFMNTSKEKSPDFFSKSIKSMDLRIEKITNTILAQ